MIPVYIADLKPGMVLAKSVQNSQGVLLLDAETKLTKKNIRIFKSWGVIEVFIKGNQNPPKKSKEQLGEGAVDTIELELKTKFADVMDDPVMVEIFKAARNQMTKNLPHNQHEE